MLLWYSLFSISLFCVIQFVVVNPELKKNCYVQGVFRPKLVICQHNMVSDESIRQRVNFHKASVIPVTRQRGVVQLKRLSKKKSKKNDFLMILNKPRMGSCGVFQKASCWFPVDCRTQTVSQGSQRCRKNWHPYTEWTVESSWNRYFLSTSCSWPGNP